MPDLKLIEGGKPTPIKLASFKRDNHYGECALIYFDRRPTENEMAFLRECMSRAVALMPDDIG